MVVKLGIEIELACTRTSKTDILMYSDLNGKWKICGDGSIKCKHLRYGICEECNALGIKQTEFKTTNPYTLNMRNLNESITEILTDVKKIYESLKNISGNESCGIHFHFSGIKKWQIFYSEKFLETLKEKYTAICETTQELNRLHNMYAEWCKFTQRPQNGSRYRALNIVDAYDLHNTFEFRFLPSTDKISVFKKYLVFIINILNEVYKTKYPEEKIVIETDISENKKEIKTFI